MMPKSARPLLCVFLFLSLFFYASNDVSATDYYLSSTGNDSNSGRSVASAWRSTYRLNQQQLFAGDRVYFQGGSVFQGAIYIDANDRGTALVPILFSTYGPGRATIEGMSDIYQGAGFFAYNTGGIRIHNLRFTTNQPNIGTHGVNFYNELPNNAKLEYVFIDNVEVDNFGGYGISIGGWNGRSGYRNVRIARAHVHDNQRGGIATFSQAMYGLEDVYVGYSKVHNNKGLESITATGSGIIVGGVQSAKIERNIVYSNGELSTSSVGPIGIWAYDSNSVTIQFNEAYLNKGINSNGGGILLEQNISNSIVQYNYTHDNDGSGIALNHAPPNSNHTNNVVRYNISQNDGRKRISAGILLWGQIVNSQIYNNTVYMGGGSTGTPRAMTIANWNITGNFVQNLIVRNNIFYTTGSIPMLEITQDQLRGSSNVYFHGNNYYNTQGTPRILWGTNLYTSLPAWRLEMGQERLDGVDTGTTANPLLTNAGGGFTINDPLELSRLLQYTLQSTSSLIDKGLPIGNSATNPQDFFGNPVPDGTHDVGAHEVNKSARPTMTPSYIAPCSLADSNCDDVVDGADYVAWALNYSKLTTRESFAGDYNSDRKVDGVDYVIWLSRYVR